MVTKTYLAHLPLQRPLGPGAVVSCRRLLNPPRQSVTGRRRGKYIFRTKVRPKGCLPFRKEPHPSLTSSRTPPCQPLAPPAPQNPFKNPLQRRTPKKTAQIVPNGLPNGSPNPPKIAKNWLRKGFRIVFRFWVAFGSVPGEPHVAQMQ